MIDDDVPPPLWADVSVSARLDQLLAQGESQTVEFKAQIPSQVRDLAKVIAGFATSNDGIILIGVSNDGRVVGLDENADDPKVRDDLRSRIEGLCSNVVKPLVTPSVKFGWKQGKAVLFVEIPKGQRPLYYVHNVPFIRQSTRSRPVEPQEVEEIILQANQIGLPVGDDAVVSMFSLPSDHIGLRGLAPGALLCRYDDQAGKPLEVNLVGNACMTVKVCPSIITRHWSQTVLRDLIGEAPELVAPMRHSKLPLKWSRSDAGAAIWTADPTLSKVTRAATLLQQDGTIWSTECALLESETLKADFHTAEGFIPTGALEEAFENALPRFYEFATAYLKLPPPLTVYVSVSGIKGYRLGVDHGFTGYFMQDGVHESFSLSDLGESYRERLCTFFEKIWEDAGEKRPTRPVALPSG